MVITIVITAFICILLGMFASVKLFGTGGKRARIFDDIYFSFEEDNETGVIYTKKGDYSAILRIENPVKKYATDINGYYEFNSLMDSVLKVLGEGYAVHKQDIFSRNNFDMSKISNTETDKRKRFLSDSYFRFFNGRRYTAQSSYLIITQRNRQGGFKAYDPHKYKDFLVKIRKVYDRLKSAQIKCRFLEGKECQEYADRYFTMNFKDDIIAKTDFKVDNEKIGMGDEIVKVFSLLDVDKVGLPSHIRPYSEVSVNNIVLQQDLLSEIDQLPDVETVVYNQMIFLPNQKREIMKLDKKKNRHASIPNPSNQIAVEDIKQVQDLIAREGKQLVYAHYNIIIKAKANKDLQKITNALENILARYSMSISKRAYNQLELFVASFPGNCFETSNTYDRFLTLSDAAVCLMYKEHQAEGEDTPLKCYYTDRQGVPVCIDITGKEGQKRLTDNSNFFVLGPSGSGKSFFMNTVMRQYYEQDTDIVIVDTGDSYEGLCSYFEGKYITYSKESPISMNPFKIKQEEYEENFSEKKEFLKNLIFMIYKGKEEPTKLEETIINNTLKEYFDNYFHPFEGFTEEEKDVIREQIILNDKANGKYNSYEEEEEERLDDYEKVSSAAKNMNLSERDRRIIVPLQAIIEDNATTEGEKEAAKNQLMRILSPEVIKNKYLMRVERQLERIEREKKRLRVTELSFNSYYEFALERIPQMLRQQNIKFSINDFAAILKPFYKGGELENTLNNDMDATLFDEKFIVFEIDKIKDNPVLFPIITLIIMDVFTQKMRLKTGRKCLVIEEAWKAIATPTMADYIKYLYKTARKHWAMVGVVTQEIEDITGSKIVKDAIISNSGVFMLLDQAKFKDKFDKIRDTLALTENDCKKIFTINRLENKEGRSPFKEVFIKRGQDGEVFGIEEPAECYMTYTTEKAEKMALKLYKRLLKSDHQVAIEYFVRDWKLSGYKKSLDFARLVLKEQKVFNYQTQQPKKRKGYQ